MFRKILMVSAIASAGLSMAVMAEESRAFLTTENKFPELGQLELSYLLENNQYDGYDFISHNVQARYGLIENLTARLAVPFAMYDPEEGNSESGLGDIKLGFDLLAYEDIFRYPYVIPHVEMAFPTGEEDDGLGGGEFSYGGGISVGTVVYDCLHYVVDGTYIADADTHTGVTDDAAIGSLSIIWDISERFSVMGEGRLVNYNDADDTASMIGGGISYAWTENLGSSIYGATWPDAVYNEDQTLLLKVNYTF